MHRVGQRTKNGWGHLTRSGSPSHCTSCLLQHHHQDPSLQPGPGSYFLGLGKLGPVANSSSQPRSHQEFFAPADSGGSQTEWRLLTCLCWAPVTFPKPRGISWAQGCRLLPPQVTSSSLPLQSLNLSGTHPCLRMPPARSPFIAPSEQPELFPLVPCKVKRVSSFREASWSRWNADTQLQGPGQVTLPFWVFVSSPTWWG